MEDVDNYKLNFDKLDEKKNKSTTFVNYMKL